MKLSSRIFLVLLRVVIGWHFLVEGLYKFEVPWSSEAYLHESSGPLAPVFHGVADDAVTAKLTLRPASSSVEEENADRFPPALARDWNDYRDHFFHYYHLDGADEGDARDAVNDTFAQSKASFVHWAVTGKGGPVVTAPFTTAKAEYKLPLDRRLQDYADKQADVTRLQAETLHPSAEAGKPEHAYAEKQLADAKKELAAMRSSLHDDLRRQTRAMEDALLTALEATSGASEKLAMPEPGRLPWRDWNARERALWFAYWALIVLAVWSVGAFVRCTAAITGSWSAKSWLLWLAWFGVIFVSAIGVTCVLGVPWWRSWKPYTVTAHALTGWLYIAVCVSFLAVAVLTFARRASEADDPSSLASMGTVAFTGILLVAALLLQFAASWLTFSRLEWADALVTWGLVTIGACLLAGFCTRTAAIAGALLVFSFWLAMPPLPWLPAPPNAEGHYQWINKNIIEGIALLVLASTAVGQWFGADGFLRYLDPRAWGTLAPKLQTSPTGVNDNVASVRPLTSVHANGDEEPEDQNDRVKPMSDL